MAYKLPYSELADIKLNQNEYIVNVTMNRPLTRLFDNDVYLLSLIKDLSGEMVTFKNLLEGEMNTLSGALVNEINTFKTTINNYLDSVMPTLENGVIPIGASILWPLTTNCPSHFSFDDGTSLVRATYPTLFNLIGTSFGAPSPSTFSKPNYGTIWNQAAITNTLYATAYAHGDDNNTYASVSTEGSYLHLQARVWGGDGDGGDNSIAYIGLGTQLAAGNKLHIEYAYTVDRSLAGSYLTSTVIGVLGSTVSPATYDWDHPIHKRIHQGTTLQTGDLFLNRCDTTYNGVWQSFTSPSVPGGYYHTAAIGFGYIPAMVNLTLNLYISNISIYSSSDELLLTVYSPTVAAALGVSLAVKTDASYGGSDGYDITNPPVLVITSNILGTSSEYAIRAE